jgi:hypothetical protein
MIDSVIKNHVIPEFVDRLEKLAGEQLHKTRSIYQSAIRVIDEGRMKGAVLLSYQNPLVKMIEEGCSAFDQKIFFEQSSKKHTTKNGKWFLTIPFNIGTPDSTGEFVSSVMPSEVYDVVKEKSADMPTTSGAFKSKGLALNEIPEQFATPRTRALIEATATNQRWEAYKNKTSIYEGISKIQDPTTGQSSYKSFRRVSSNSDPNSWIFPGMTEKDLMGKALQEIESDEGKIVGNGIKVEMAQMGFNL